MSAANKDFALAILMNGLMGGRLRIIYQQHMQPRRLKRSFIHTLRLSLVDAELTLLPSLAREVFRFTHFDTKK